MSNEGVQCVFTVRNQLAAAAALNFQLRTYIACSFWQKLETNVYMNLTCAFNIYVGIIIAPQIEILSGSKQKASLTIHACPFFVFGNVVLQHAHTLGISFKWFFPHAFIKKPPKKKKTICFRLLNICQKDKLFIRIPFVKRQSKVMFCTLFLVY